MEGRRNRGKINGALDRLSTRKVALSAVQDRDELRILIYQGKGVGVTLSQGSSAIRQRLKNKKLNPLYKLQFKSSSKIITRASKGMIVSLSFIPSYVRSLSSLAFSLLSSPISGMASSPAYILTSSILYIDGL